MESTEEKIQNAHRQKVEEIDLRRVAWDGTLSMDRNGKKLCKNSSDMLK